VADSSSSSYSDGAALASPTAPIDVKYLPEPKKLTSAPTIHVRTTTATKQHRSSMYL